MQHADLILTLTSGLTAALVLGYFTQRMGLSPIVGYLMAGVALGPHTPGFIANLELAEQVAEIGVILLMFGVGLHLRLEELLAVGRVAIPGAIGQSVVTTAMMAGVVRGIGWDWGAALVFGAGVSVASTVVLLRVLADNRDLHSRTGHIAVGWLVAEDLLTVLVLVLLPALVEAQQGGFGGLPFALALASGKVSLLMVLVFVVGGRVVPWLLERVAGTRSRELFTLTVLVLALGIAVGSARLFGVSMALGAFLAGMVVGRSEFSLRAATEALPMRDAFAVLFFVSVGMLFRPETLLNAPSLVAATCAVILVGKPAAALGIVLLLRYPWKVAMSVAIALAQIGEFSFILANLGRELAILPEIAPGVLVAASIISITLNPLLYRTLPRLERWWTRANTVTTPESTTKVDDHESPRHRAIIVGYGPVGRTLTRLLRENGIAPTVIELNLETIRKLRDDGIEAVYGDASHRDTLTAAGVREAGSLILSSAGMSHSEEVIRIAKELNPAIRILARAGYVLELDPLRHAGATAFSEEGEVALALIEAVLRPLGATAEQIDHERDRFRTEVMGVPR